MLLQLIYNSHDLISPYCFTVLYNVSYILFNFLCSAGTVTISLVPQLFKSSELFDTLLYTENY